MIPVSSPREMTAADDAAAHAGISTADLMYRAGAAVARAALDVAGGIYGLRFLVVCGKGNNAGDGFVAARLLKLRGAHVVVVALEEVSHLSRDSRAAFESLGPVRVVPSSRLESEALRADVIVDALVGTGLRGPLEGEYAAACDAINISDGAVISVDIPSGVDGTSGAVAGPAVWADVTVTMAALKPGLVLLPGAERAGNVEVVDIGMPPGVLEHSGFVVEADDVAGLLPPRSLTAHKRSVGKVLVVAGSKAMAGAGALSARGALRTGAGLVRLAVPESAAERVRTWPELIVSGLSETDEGEFGATAVDEVLELAADFDAVAVGPGLGRSQQTQEFVRKCIAALDVPVVVDADALYAFTSDVEGLRRAAPTILTPHAAELARLLDSSVQDVESDRVGHARRVAEKTGAVVLLKGFHTIVVHEGDPIAFVPTGGPVLATAGTGDVLTGMVAAMVCEADPFEAAWAASYLHGAAGDLIDDSRGERGAVASEVAEAVPLILEELEWD